MTMILLLHGPNLNKLGERNPTHYGHITLKGLEETVMAHAAKQNIQVACIQSNHEGVLIDAIQSHKADAILINPGAFTHYSYALHDALVDAGVPAVEIHLSDIHAREPWRAHSVIAPACIHSISGKQVDGYLEAIDFLASRLQHED